MREGEISIWTGWKRCWRNRTMCKTQDIFAAGASRRAAGWGGSKASKAVRRAALKYEHLPEAAVADAVFGVQGREKEKAIEALQRLAKLDTEILPPL
ncbi:Uncharacterised protein [Neisseria gonorrhoeae]|uniref:Uncharacterized protein n=1 Tax=Neisseria gonorrhoeae TaxID=485 RepID=A0A378VZI5_NEIGO|nr:Uncharacterised protein [Neisseria gonorrhoeae]